MGSAAAMPLLPASMEAEEAERTVVGAVLDALRGTGRTFVYNSGVWVMGDTP